jgi:thiamine-phosphate pyrophosphorylase
MDPANWQTYLVTQESLSAGRSTVEIVDAAIAGGIDVVQLREKDTTARSRYQLGTAVREQTAAAGLPLLVNDRVDIAQAIDADGVHLGDSDLPIEAAREILGADAIVGRSASTVAAAKNAEATGADYLGVGAVYATGSKDDIDDEEYEIGPERVTEIVQAVSIPVIGIGGITPENAGDVVGAGADGVAVISAITAADEPQAVTATLGEVVARA